jgi:hypothetical protein
MKKPSKIWTLSLAVIAASILVTAAWLSRSQGQWVTLAGFGGTLPAQWVRQPAAEGSGELRFVIPGADGANPANAVLRFVSPVLHDSPEADIERWRRRFQVPNGDPANPRLRVFDNDAGIATTTIELEGAYVSDRTERGNSSAVPDQALLAGILETSRGQLYLELWGPRPTVDAQKAAFGSYVRGVREL